MHYTDISKIIHLSPAPCPLPGIAAFDRMEAQREIRPRLPKREKTEDGGASSSALNDDDAAMLDMTLTMLRCSICRDRFKNVVITRCFHTFCKECIDESLRNRSRKCPACGDKFDQSDVKNIYFTH